MSTVGSALVAGESRWSAECARRPAPASVAAQAAPTRAATLKTRRFMVVPQVWLFRCCRRRTRERVRRFHLICGALAERGPGGSTGGEVRISRQVVHGMTSGMFLNTSHAFAFLPLGGHCGRRLAGRHLHG